MATRLPASERTCEDLMTFIEIRSVLQTLARRTMPCTSYLKAVVLRRKEDKDG